MRGRVRRPHVEDHLFANVAIGVVQLCIRRDDSCHGIRRFNLTCRERHGKVTRLQRHNAKPIIFTLASEPERASKFGTVQVERRSVERFSDPSLPFAFESPEADIDGEVA